VIDDAGEVLAAFEEVSSSGVIGLEGEAGNEGTGNLGTPSFLLGEFALMLLDDVEPEAGGGEKALREFVDA
jgi:hypothetical protein